MRRITILAVAALAAVTTSFAQPAMQRKKAPKQELTKAPERHAIKLGDVDLTTARVQENGPMAFANAKRNQAKHAKDGKMLRARKGKVSPRRNAEIIIDQPAGTLHQMVYSANSYAYNWLIGYYVTTYSARIGEVVEGTDGNIYIHNLLTDLNTDEGYWVKAEKAQGDTIVIHEQPIWEENYYGTIYTHSILKVNIVDGQMMIPDNTDIKMIWKDNKLTTVDEFNTSVNEMKSIITGIDDGGYWSMAANWNISMEVQTDVPITELPAGVEPQNMVMKYHNDANELEASKVKFAVSGNDAYLQYYDGIDSWIKGTIDGGKITFPTRQYLGADTEYSTHLYFMAVPADDDYFAQVVDEVSFDYDPANMVLNNTGNWIFANGGKTEIYYLEAYQMPYIYKFVEVPATPKTPEITDFIQYNPKYGYGFFDFEAPSFDVDENYIDPDKMYYKVFFDDKEFTFDPYEFTDFEVPTTDIPYTLNTWTFYADGALRELELRFNVQKNIGVQMFYAGGGEVHSSDIVWYEVDGGAVTGDEGFVALVENGTANSNLKEGEVAVNLGELIDGFNTGTADDEAYDVCFHINDPSLVGAQLTAINVPFSATTGISNARVWLSNKIGIQDGKFQADVVTKNFVPARGFNQVALDEPYTIPEGGVYVGFSFDQAYDPALEKQPTPVLLTGYTTNGGFLIHSKWAYRQGWTSLWGRFGDLAIEAVLKGGNIVANNSKIEEIEEFYAKTGEEGTMNIYIINYGYKGVNNFDYEYSVNGQNGTKHVVLDPVIEPVYGSYQCLPVFVPAINQKGSYEIAVKVTTVNGQPNTSAAEVAKGTVHVLNTMPKKRPLLEEYTGTWCGWCPRGWVALEKMNKLYPEDFVALSYHNDDPMEFTYEFPSDVQGFPDAWIDRYYETDAYIGDYSEAVWGFEEVWKKLSQNFGVADLNVTAEWDEAQQNININTVANFPIAQENCNYGLAYALVADGLKGNTDDWAQSNYYSGDYTWPAADFKQFVMGDEYITGLTFNDVICNTSGYEGIEGSLPTNIAEDGCYGHTYQFNANEAVNTSGEPIIQDKNKVRVVVMLIDNNTGIVLNSNKCNVLPAGTGISNTNANTQVESVNYYDLSGRKVLLPNGGVYIKSVKYKNGQTVNEKVLVK